MTEAEVQAALSKHCREKSQTIHLPNSMVLGWESDMIGLTRAGTMHEYEVKVSFADFKADAKKEKHQHIQRFLRGEMQYERESFGQRWMVDTPRPANFFWYVVPAEIQVPIVDLLPPYAGMLVVKKWGRLGVLRKAPRLHREKPTVEQLIQMLGSACGRYWTLKNRTPKETETRSDTRRMK